MQHGARRRDVEGDDRLRGEAGDGRLLGDAGDGRWRGRWDGVGGGESAGRGVELVVRLSGGVQDGLGFGKDGRGVVR